MRKQSLRSWITSLRSYRQQWSGHFLWVSHRCGPENVLTGVLRWSCTLSPWEWVPEWDLDNHKQLHLTFIVYHTKIAFCVLHNMKKVGTHWPAAALKVRGGNIYLQVPTTIFLSASQVQEECPNQCQLGKVWRGNHRSLLKGEEEMFGACFPGAGE